MSKEISQEKKYFSISEVSKLCNIKAHTLRFWEKEFDDLSPATRKGSRRYYQEHDMKLIKQIHHLLNEEGMTITGAKKSLKNSDSKEFKSDKSQDVVQDLEGLLKKLN